MTGADALAGARRVADAVLYEGYVLFPYRSSATKNRYRWQFGVVVPTAQVVAGSTEPDEVVSQCLLRVGPATRVEVIVRFLRVRRRAVEVLEAGAHRWVEQTEVDGQLVTSWDEGLEHEVSTGALAVDDLLAAEQVVEIALPAARSEEPLGAGGSAGRVVRTDEPLTGVLRVTAERLDDGVVRVTTTVRNTTPWAATGAARDEVMRRSLIGVHLLLAADLGSFASLTDPPEWAQGWVASLTNRHTYPVLAGTHGRDDVVLSSPIILADHPQLAPESTGDAFDATEIDELLMLAVQALTDEEKRHARATDPRAAQVIDRADHLPPEVMERLHGAVRQFDPPVMTAAADPGDRGDRGEHRKMLDHELMEFLGVDEAPLEQVTVGGQAVAVGDRVRLRPSRRADAQDLFAAGRIARVAAIERDLDGDTYVGVTLEDDPAADLHEAARRYLYYHPDEVEPVQASGAIRPRPDD
ncbi:MAG: hypothetical protein WD080_08970 [Egibacteraceae bacterium]